MLCHLLAKKCVICMALFFMNCPQLPKPVHKKNCKGISSVPGMTLHSFIFLICVLMWEIILLPVRADVNKVLGRKPCNKSSQKHTPYFWTKCSIIVCIILLHFFRYHLFFI